MNGKQQTQNNKQINKPTNLTCEALAKDDNKSTQNKKIKPQC